ncbi:NUDIX hydrolase [Microbacterium sp. BG28]|uniref:NUDIX hydrolase n=1 Tax=Microbacterium sp. BG28 TaxID=3097356 RepID=UPI002A5ACC36|nr:NUDIX hydrolase [Microbacterium sp. BG28]MDY0827754.1 NUDIX hydrolase [Microbacterium sp. BG28]
MDDHSEPRWTVIGRSVAYDGRVTLVDHTVLLPDGSQSSYEVDESVPFSVATLVVDGADVLLSRQYRYAIDRWIYDLPGGGGQADEDPRTAAQRELEEELGIVPDDLRHLHTFFMNPGRAAWPTHLFISTAGFTWARPDASDPAEQVRLVRMRLVELDALISRGLVVDPPLIVARALGAATGYLPPLRPVGTR